MKLSLFRALSLTQPWATAVALGLKTWETRSWPTNYRGPLFIHAAKSFPVEARIFAGYERSLGRLPARLPLGVIVCSCEIVDCRRTVDVVGDLNPTDLLYGDYSVGRWAFKLINAQVLREPVAARGALGLWQPSDAIVSAVRAQVPGGFDVP